MTDRPNERSTTTTITTNRTNSHQPMFNQPKQAKSSGLGGPAADDKRPTDHSKFEKSAYERLLEPSCSCLDAVISKRFQIAILSSIGFLISFGIRCNLGVAIIKMTSPIKTEDNKIVVSFSFGSQQQQHTHTHTQTLLFDDKDNNNNNNNCRVSTSSVYLMTHITSRFSFQSAFAFAIATPSLSSSRFHWLGNYRERACASPPPQPVCALTIWPAPVNQRP